MTDDQNQSRKMGLFCSTIIPTVGRDTLTRAVCSVLEQQATVNFEIIVVNDAVQSLAVADWQQSPQVRIINTYQHERSVARNTGAAIARGRYLHFLDDDDWLLPWALARLHELSLRCEAAWLYGGSRLVNRSGRPLAELAHRIKSDVFLHAMAGEWIPLQASLIRADAFFAVGGFNPDISGPEDVDLLRRITLHYTVASTPADLAAISWGRRGSTTDYAHHAASSRRAREKILDRPEVFMRLHHSAEDSNWFGRIIRIYLTSTIWNLRHGRLFSALGRMLLAFYCLLKAGPRRLLSSDLWRSIFHAYESKSFENGIKNKDVLVD